MKGNYQDEQPLMKVSPEAAGASGADYQVQQYAWTPTDAQHNDEEIIFSLATADQDLSSNL